MHSFLPSATASYTERYGQLGALNKHPLQNQRKIVAIMFR